MSGDGGAARGEYAAMGDNDRERLQAEVDANEHDVEIRYERWQQLMSAIAEGARRADAMCRLERALELRLAG
ncbi:MAG TPA: hypothetical protein VFO60_06660 [Candidatus Dormibacteraeota bacterium]|nr:hypothetical protein [Candidatus Dormibacteraeota bacterium]